jgi:hypothetical protein
MIGFARIAIFVVLLGFNHLELAEIQRWTVALS